MLHKDNCKARRETFEFWDLVRLIVEILRYLKTDAMMSNSIAHVAFE